MSFRSTPTYQILSVAIYKDVFAFGNSRNGGYLLWLEMHARAIKPLEGEEQCAIEVQFSSVHFDLITQEMLHLQLIGGFHAGPGPH